MRKFFRRFLCVIGFSVLTVVCAHADTTLLVVNQLTPEAISLIDGNNSVQLAPEESIANVVFARVVLFNKHDRYVILSVKNDSEFTSYETQEPYWLRSHKCLGAVRVLGRCRYITGPVGLSKGTIDQVLRVVPRTDTTAMASDAPDESLESVNSSDLSADSYSSVADDACMDDQNSYDDIPGISAESPFASPAHSPVSIDQRRGVKLTIVGNDGVLRTFEGTTFSDENSLRALVGGTIIEAECLR